jgi:hypothetical protein
MAWKLTVARASHSVKKKKLGSPCYIIVFVCVINEKAMMKTCLIIIATCFFLMACKKSEPISPGLFGKWELRRMYGGLAGFDSTYKAGNGRIYQFNRDSTYKHFTMNKQDAQGVYHIKKNNNPFANSVDEIIFDNNIYGDPFSLNGTKLTIGTAIADGIAMDYVKIKNE